MVAPKIPPALRRLGFTPAVAERFRSLDAASAEPARVTGRARDRFRLGAVGGEFDARAAPGIDPAVGDWVAAVPPREGAPGSVIAVLERTSLLSRRAPGAAEVEQIIAANIDTVFVVMGLDGDYNLRRLERYLVTVADSGADPVVVLTKADIANDPIGARIDAQSAAPGVPVHAISAMTGVGLEPLEPFLREGATVALVGSSGAGKSTLVNTLAGEELMATRAVRESDSHGRHTTTERRLLSLPGGALIVDMPGLREIQLWVDPPALDAAFPEIDVLAPDCRFRDCTHGDEPGCAVVGAAADGRLDPARLSAWRQLRAEIEGAALRRDVAARRQEGRRLGRIYREAKKRKRRNR